MKQIATYTRAYHFRSVSTAIMCLVCTLSWRTLRDEAVTAANHIAPVRILFDPYEALRQITISDRMGYLPNSRGMGLSQIDAFENNEHFAYLRGTAQVSFPIKSKVVADADIEVARRVFFIKPDLFLVDDQLRFELEDKTIEADVTPQISTLNGAVPNADSAVQFVSCCLLRNHRTAVEAVDSKRSSPATTTWIRTLHAVRRKSAGITPFPTCTIGPRSGSVNVELPCSATNVASKYTIRLSMPLGLEEGHVETVSETDEKHELRRLLPSGILSPEPEAATRRLQWDLPYQIDGMATWDTRHPSSELMRAVESRELVPCRVVEFGCGTGNDAIYLAAQGFEVTAIDISPTALAIAERKALESKVNVKWLLADILQPPNCGPFELVFDRGCYHEVRRHHAVEYVNAIRKLTHSGSKILILAGNNNNDSYWRFDGPARVRALDIQRDFVSGFRLRQLREFRFDPAHPQQQGALAWSILLDRLSDHSALSR